MIKEGLYLFPAEDGHPGFVGNRRAMRICGCSIFIGVRLDNKEPASITRACGDEHKPDIERVHAAYEASMGGNRPDLDDLPAEEAAEIVMEEVFPSP